MPFCALLLLLASVHHVAVECCDAATDDVSILQQHMRGADTLDALESRLEERLNGMEKRLLAWPTGSVAPMAAQNTPSNPQLPAAASRMNALGSISTTYQQPFSDEQAQGMADFDLSGLNQPQTLQETSADMVERGFRQGWRPAWWRKARQEFAQPSREETEMIRELRDELTRQVERNGEQHFHDQEVQSRLEEQLNKQTENVQFLLQEVHKVEESAQHESKYLTRMAHDVLAMNSSLRDSAAQNSQQIGVLFHHQQADEAQIAHTDQMVNGLQRTQQEDEAKLSTHDGSITELNKVQQEDETKLGQTAQQVLNMASQVESVDQSQERMHLDLVAAEQNLNHQGQSLESLATKISGLGSRINELQTDFAGALQSHGAEILQNKESVDRVDEAVSALKTTRETDLQKMLGLYEKHEELAMDVAQVKEKQALNMAAVNETVASIVDAVEKAGDVVSALNRSQTKDLLSLSNETFELKEFMLKVQAQLIQQGAHLDNLTEKHWNKVTEHEARMADLRQLIANLSIDVSEKLGTLDTIWSTRLAQNAQGVLANQATIQHLQESLEAWAPGSLSPTRNADANGSNFTVINQTTTSDELEDLARFTTPKLVGELKEDPDLLGPRDVKIHESTHAFIVTSKNPGLSVVSLEDPEHPSLIGTVHNENLMAEARAVALSRESGHHAFVVASNSASVTAIDISDPARMRVVGSLQDKVALSGARAIAVQGGYAFVAGTYSHTLCVIDVSQPAHMTLTGKLHDADDLQFPTSVDVVDNFVFVTSSSGHALVIVDVSNPSLPEKYSVLGDAPSLREARCVVVQGKYAYVASATPNTLSVIDISDKRNPLLVAVVERATADMASHVAVDCRFAYVASAYHDALTVLDIRNPRKPVYVGTLRDHSLLNGIETVAISGKFGVFVSPTNDAMVAWQLPYYCDTESPLESKQLPGAGSEPANVSTAQTAVTW